MSKTLVVCPHCDSDEVVTVFKYDPSVNFEGFKCEDCGTGFPTSEAIYKERSIKMGEIIGHYETPDEQEMRKRNDRRRKIAVVKQAVNGLQEVQSHKDTLRDLMIDISYRNNEIAKRYDGDMGAAYTDRALICTYVGEYASIWCPMRDVDANYDVDPFEYYGMDFVLQLAEVWIQREQSKMEVN